MYVDWVDPAGTHDAFYTNPTIVGLYRQCPPDRAPAPMLTPAQKSMSRRS
jgi:hypothetical protein